MTFMSVRTTAISTDPIIRAVKRATEPILDERIVAAKLRAMELAENELHRRVGVRQRWGVDYHDCFEMQKAVQAGEVVKVALANFHPAARYIEYFVAPHEIRARRRPRLRFPHRSLPQHLPAVPGDLVTAMVVQGSGYSKRYRIVERAVRTAFKLR